MPVKTNKQRDRFDPLLREVAEQLGAVLEAGLTLAMRQTQAVLSVVVRRMAEEAERDSPEKAVLDQANSSLKMFSKVSTIVPPVAGEFTKVSSFLVMSTGLKLLRAFNKELSTLR